jgi:hypothetical protein
MANHGERTPVTLLMRPDAIATMDEEAESETVLGVERRLIILEMLSVSAQDYDEDFFKEAG